MLLKEAGRTTTVDWYLIARHGDLTAKAIAGLRVGEDEHGELRLDPTAAQALIEFAINPARQLKVSVLSETLELSLPNNARSPSAYIDDVKGARIHLPNNTLTISTDFVAADRHPDAIDIEVVQIPIVTVPAAAKPQPFPDNIPTLEIEVPFLKIPLLDTPLEAIAEPLVAELPYAQQRAVPRRSSKRMSRLLITAVAVGLLAAVCLAFVLQTFMAGNGSSIGAVAQLTAAQRLQATTPTLVMLEESTPIPPPQQVTGPAPTADPIPAPSPTPVLAEPTSELDRYLAEALTRYEAGHITDPVGASSVAALRFVLYRDRGNPQALALLRRCADRTVEIAKQADEFDRNYEARNLIEEVMAFYPDHQEARSLWARWTHEGS